MTAAEGDEEKTTTTAIWTTWEELLLACAVKRHGLKDWETVAMEIQTRTNPSLANLFTPQICVEKYHQLKRRFRDETPAAAADDGDVTVPWIEELRQLRVAELTQDVQRYDRSIQSLQLKVKRLEAEREQSQKESGENNDARADLERSENDKIDADGVPAAVLPANSTGKVVSGEFSNRSFNESNSSESREKSGRERDFESEPVQTSTGDGDGSLNPDPESKVVRENSCNDSSDTVARHLAANKSHARKKNSNESRDSEGAKASSDVQSSASLTKKKRRKQGEVSHGGGSKGEPVEVSPSTTATTTITKRDVVVVKFDPLVAVMDIIRAHKHGSMFERRLESQKSDKYNKIVRQHVDLRIVQTRIDDGSYSSCTNKFFLDLLLIFNNAIVFFPKQSTESIAAQQLRLLVLKEIRKPKRPDPMPKSELTPLVVKPDPERSDSLLAMAKQKSAVPIVVCRKRSSISGKPSSSKAAVVEKEKQKEKEPVVDAVAKTVVIQKPPVKTSLINEDEDSMKMKIKEKPVTGVRSMRRSGNNSSRSNSTSNVAPSKNQITSSSSNLGNSTSKGSDGGGGGHGSPAKVEKKKGTEVTPVVKKRGAADFLKRLKKNSPQKETPAVEEDGGKKDPVKKKVEGRKDGLAARQKGGGDGGSGGGRQVKEDDSPSKRSVGRPSKKGKEVVAPAKRRREKVEPESASKRPTKRSKR